MQVESKFNKGICFYCGISTFIFCKYLWAVPWKDKRGTTIPNAFQTIIDRSNRKPNKIWIDNSSEFSNRSMKSQL